MITRKISIITSLYRGEQFLASYLNHLAGICNPEECELILVHNDPTTQEISLLEKFDNPGIHIQHLLVDREPLYCSWNRAIKVANGKYLTIWNVDDVRSPYSILSQANALDKNPKSAIAYGNFVTINVYGTQEGITVNPPDFLDNSKIFLRKHQIGSFPMWRKDIHSTIGYFDEQYSLVADLDFQIRVAQEFPLVKVNEHLGYYLAGTPDNLSSNYKLQDYEHTALHLRYGNFDLIHLTYLLSVNNNFKINKYKWFGDYYPVKQWFRLSEKHFIKNLPLISIAMAKFPRHIARKYVRAVARKYLKYHLWNKRAKYLANKADPEFI